MVFQLIMTVGHLFIGMGWLTGQLFQPLHHSCLVSNFGALYNFITQENLEATLVFSSLIVSTKYGITAVAFAKCCY
ncbi:hypothetical protein DEO72_LG6g1456 [Vigna unguiculata]|uniref:Uncharacterized protein n=1 Tax=Vigna unguiculata TaxID=3917 RepID=A0A4D6M762_VIGUN|nr:hypothetical protein DEO72_LG6g1456 [Vigna unguiculata]